MSINQITKVRLYNSNKGGFEEVALVDWSERPLYSTIDIHDNADDQEMRLFSYTETENVAKAGGTTSDDRTATLSDTNIASSSSMDSTEEFLVFGIGVELHQLVVDENNVQVVNEPMRPMPAMVNVARLHQVLVLELEVSEKAFPQAPIGYFPAGFGPFAHFTSDATAAATSSAATNGFPSYEALCHMSVPVHLGGTEDYSVLLHQQELDNLQFFTDAGAADNDAVIRARVYLRGLHKRPTA